MALSSPPAKGVVITVPVLILAASVAAIFFFFLLSSLSSCDCPLSATSGVPVPDRAGESFGAPVTERIWATKEDVEWVRDQIRVNGLHMQDNVLRKGINPRTRAQQLQDLLQFVLSYPSICHYKCLCVFDFLFVTSN